MLNDEQILGFIPTVKVYKDKPPIRMVWLQQRHVLQVARAVEAEVRNQDEALIRQLVEALEAAQKHHCTTSMPMAIKNYGTLESARSAGVAAWREMVPGAIAAARARLEGKRDGASNT